MISLETNGKDYGLQYCLRGWQEPPEKCLWQVEQLSGTSNPLPPLRPRSAGSWLLQTRVNLGQLAGQRNGQFGKWRRIWLKGLSHFGGFGCPDVMIQPLGDSGRGWFTCKVGPLGSLATTEEAEGTGLWSASALTSCWLSVPAVTLQLPLSVLKKELMSVEPSLLTHMASLIVPSRLGYIQSI